MEAPSRSAASRVNHLFTSAAQPQSKLYWAHVGPGATPQGSPEMASLIRYYLDYRRVGLGRVAALRFAWTMVMTRSRPMSIR